MVPSFKNVRSLGPLYTSGPTAFTPDGSRIITCVGEDVLLTDVETGSEICRFLGVSSACHRLSVLLLMPRHRTRRQSIRYVSPQQALTLPYFPPLYLFDSTSYLPILQ